MATAEQNDAARERLATLVVIPGELKIITPRFLPELRANPDEHLSKPPEPGPQATEDERREYAAMLRRPSSHILLDVVRIEEVPTMAGYVAAVASCGSATMGEPADVLARLRQWESEG